MRLTGLASGFDTETMVQQLMQVEKMKVNRYEQSKQVNLWKQESYNNMNKTFANFILNTKKDLGLNKVSSTGLVTNSSFSNLDYVRKVQSNDEKVATAKMIGKSANGSFVIDVQKMGKDATFVSDKLDLNETLKDDFVIEGVLIAKKGAKMSEAVKNLENNKELKKKDVSAFFDKSTGKIFAQGSNIEGNLEIRGLKENVSSSNMYEYNLGTADLNGPGNIQIGGKAVKGNTLEEQLKELEKNPGEYGLVSFSRDGEKVTFSTRSGLKNEAGEEIVSPKLVITGLGTEEKYTPASQAGKSKFVSGEKGKATINGAEVEVNNNKILFNGLEIEIKSKGVTTLNITTNTEGIMEKIENFITEYNKLVEDMSGKVKEKKYAGYHPLSKEEKEAMKEKDIEMWEEKAKSGMLNRDESVNKIMSGMRAGLYEEVTLESGEKKNLTQIGITTEKYSKGTVGGKLEIDKEKLRKAIEEDPDSVMELLFKDTPAKKGDKDPKLQGAFTRAYDTIIDGMKEIVDKSGAGEDADLLRNVKSNLLIDFVTKKGSISDLDKSILDMEKKIDSMNKMLMRKEESYYKKFTAMEKYIHQMNGQSAWIGQQMM